MILQYDNSKTQIASPWRKYAGVHGLVYLLRSYALFVSLFLTVLAFPANAEQSKSFGNYTVHYNAFTTDMLSPNIAMIYNITRSKNRVLLNISILKKVMGTTSKPVNAHVDATATNLNLQLRQLDMRELIESGNPGAIYYLAETTVTNGETLTYKISITPTGEEETHTFTFQKQFFTN